MTFLTINPGYKYFEIGLYRDNNIVDIVKEDNKKISKELIYFISSLLEKNKLNIDNLEFVIVNQGPAPFTSLRAVLATINGISFIKKIKLVGVNGIEALHTQNIKHYPNDKVITLLNAFCQDIYFAYEHNSKQIFGAQNIEKFLKDLSEVFETESKIAFVGNGAELYQDQIKQTFVNSQIFNQELILESVTEAGLKNKENFATELMPIYLKDYSC